MVQPVPVLRVQQSRPQLTLVWELLHVRSVPLAAPVPAMWGGVWGGRAYRAVHGLLTLEPWGVRFHPHRGGCWEMPPGRVSVLFLYEYSWDNIFWFLADPYNFGLDNVTDPDPGSGAFLTPGSGMGNKSRSGSGMNIPTLISEGLETFFGLKILVFFYRITILLIHIHCIWIRKQVQPFDD